MSAYEILLGLAFLGQAFAVLVLVRGNAALLESSRGHMVATTKASQASSTFSIMTMKAAMEERDNTTNSLFQIAQGEMLQELVRRHGLGPLMSAGGMVDAQIIAYQQRLGMTEPEVRQWIKMSLAEDQRANNGIGAGPDDGVHAVETGRPNL